MVGSTSVETLDENSSYVGILSLSLNCGFIYDCVLLFYSLVSVIIERLEERGRFDIYWC